LLKPKILVLTLLTALVAASVAVAKDNPGRGNAERPKPARTGADCKPKAKVVLKGTLASDPGAADTSFLLNVTKSNKHGRAYKAAAQPVTVMVDARTKVRRKQKGSRPTRTLESLAMGDRVHMDAKACKAELRNGGMPQLTARHVNAKPAPTP
jgi:hypothetical protein